MATQRNASLVRVTAPERETADAADIDPLNGEEPTRPDPQWIRGRCPECGDDLVSNLYYVGGKGYVLMWECWRSMGKTPACTYRKEM